MFQDSMTFEDSWLGCSMQVKCARRRAQMWDAGLGFGVLALRSERTVSGLRCDTKSRRTRRTQFASRNLQTSSKMPQCSCNAQQRRQSPKREAI